MRPGRVNVAHMSKNTENVPLMGCLVVAICVPLLLLGLPSVRQFVYEVLITMLNAGTYPS